MRIFISGVHGVGKSFLCDQFIKLNNNFIHLSSSELISSVRKKSWNDNKIVLTPEENQLALLQELETYNNKNILLDGHFCLIGKNNEIVQLDHSIYDKMKLSAIILLENDINIIEERFEKRNAEILFSLTELIKKERENAIKASKTYNIRLEIINSNAIDYFNGMINNIYSNQKNEH